MRKKILIFGAVMALSAGCLAGCGANNSVTDQETASPAATEDISDETDAPVVSDGADNGGVVDDLEDGVDDAVDGAEDAVDDVIDGTEDAVDDAADALDGDDTQNNTKKNNTGKNTKKNTNKNTTNDKSRNNN